MSVATIPTKTIENIILVTLLIRGGKAEPVDVYAAIETQFPKLTRKAAKNLPYNVRWTRKSLVMRGFISAKVRGEWSLTTLGRREAIKLTTV